MDINLESPTMSEDEKLIIEYLIGRQNQIDFFYESQNAKISQILTINGVIFGIIVVIIDKLVGGNQVGVGIVAFGIICIMASMV